MCRFVAAVIVICAAARGGPARAEVLIGLAGPITGKYAWFGEQMERGAAQAVADLNAERGVLGQQVRLVTADDFCDPEQAVAAARKLVGDGVMVAIGHYCSGATVPASQVYSAAGVLMIPRYRPNHTPSACGVRSGVLDRRMRLARALAGLTVAGEGRLGERIGAQSPADASGWQNHAAAGTCSRCNTKSYLTTA